MRGRGLGFTGELVASDDVGAWFRVEDLGFGVWGPGFRVESLGFRD